MALGFLDSLFDLDGDGKLTAADDFLEYMMFQESMKKAVDDEETNDNDDIWP